MTDPRPIAADHARRFLVRRQLLDPPRSLPAKPESVLRVIDRIGSLQFDPLEVPGGRNHDLVLQARIRDYRREWADQWLYAPRDERQLIELYNKMLSIVPIAELPYYRLSWTRGLTNYTEFLDEHRDLADRIRGHIRDTGPVSTAAFRDHGHLINWWWDSNQPPSTRAARAVMEAMFVAGELGISRREGSRRFYDLIERLVPAGLLAEHAPESEQIRHRLISRHRGVGLMAESGAAELVWGTGTAPERRRMTAELIEDGTLVPVRVEGLKETRHILGDEMPILEATAQPDPDHVPAVSFLAPLGPMLWDRRLVSTLFEFSYIWEVYIAGIQTAPRLLRPADPVRRPSRRPDRAPIRACHAQPAHPRHLVRGWVQTDGGAALRPGPGRGGAGVSVVRGRLRRLSGRGLASVGSSRRRPDEHPPLAAPHPLARGPGTIEAEWRTMDLPQRQRRQRADPVPAHRGAQDRAEAPQRPVLPGRRRENLVVVASNAGRDDDPSWWLNLKAHPDTEVEVGKEVRRVHARQAGSADAKRLYDRFVEALPQYGDYRKRTTREIPVVILEPR